jgi:outer membrane protein insertion porin family
MFAKQTAWSASLVAVCSAAGTARAEGDVHEVPSHGDDEAWVDTAMLGPSAPPEPREPPPPPREDPPPKPGESKPPTGSFMLGAGFSSVEGFIASASIVQDDLFRTGNHLSLHTRISQRRQLFLLRFIDPDLLGTKVGVGVDLYNDLRQRPTFDRSAAGGSLTLSHPIVGKLRAFAGYRIEEVEVEPRDGPATRGTAPLPPLGGGNISAFRAGLVYDTRDRRLAPLSGSNIGASIEVADPRWGSDLRFTRTEAWAEHHQPLGPLTLHLSGSLTTIAAPGGVPLSERLFLDTAHEIRGYSPLSFGPVDGLGRPVGGDAKLLGSAELEVPLARRIGLSAVGFVDGGGIAVRGGESVHGLSAGFGLLWRSPIGVLRFSWAFPADGGGPVFVFGMGGPW